MTARKHYTCTVDRCDKSHEAHGFCSMHYRRWKMYGDPLGRAVRQYELVCAVDGCEDPRRGLSWCTKHYQSIRRWGEDHVPFSSLRLDRVCAVEGCDQKHSANGLCGKHNRRQTHTGSVIGKQFRGKHHDNGYWYVWCPEHPNAARDGYLFEHRLVMSVILDRPLLPNENVHHINGDRADNRPENLELWSTKQPGGQRVEDKVQFAREILKAYGELFPEQP